MSIECGTQSVIWIPNEIRISIIDSFDKWPRLKDIAYFIDQGIQWSNQKGLFI